jgi:hypothetical protein
MAVPIQLGPAFTAGTPSPIFETRFSASIARGLYRVAPDGQRFVVLAAPAAQLDQPATVVLNWTSTLKR